MMHDWMIYMATFDGVPVLLLHQVDDFALACPDEVLAKCIYDIIGRHLMLAHEMEPPFKYYGILEEYNGITIMQSRDSITLSCPQYIDHVLKTHGWSAPNANEHLSSKPTPMANNVLPQLYKEVGPSEGMVEHAKLASDQGFSFRMVLGELLYAYITCRPDIGYAITMLSKFSLAPHKTHYAALKNVACYLHATKNWGIMYHKSHPDPSLPAQETTPIPKSDNLPDFPLPNKPGHLTCFIDAAHANDLHNCHSTTGYAFILCGGAVSYQMKMQSITATSSTEAEFLAAVLAVKHAKYL